MMQIINKKEAANANDLALDDLANEAAQNDAQHAPQANPAAPNNDQAQAMAAIEATTAKLLLGLLKAARTLLAKRLPELRDEWTDEVLQGPADAAVPLAKKHLETLMQIAGANPELAVFAMSLLPLMLGYMAATDRHAKNATVKTAPVATDAPQ